MSQLIMRFPRGLVMGMDDLQGKVSSGEARGRISTRCGEQAPADIGLSRQSLLQDLESLHVKLLIRKW